MPPSLKFSQSEQPPNPNFAVQNGKQFPVILNDTVGYFSPSFSGVLFPSKFRFYRQNIEFWCTNSFYKYSNSRLVNFHLSYIVHFFNARQDLLLRNSRCDRTAREPNC